MATMGGTAFTETSPPPPPLRDPEGPRERQGLFDDLVVSADRPGRSLVGLQASVFAHGLLIAAAILIPALWPSADPPQPDYVRALIYNPPPPPPPPLPKGSSMVQQPTPAKPVTKEPEPEKKPVLTADIEVPKEQELTPEHRDRQDEQYGSETGSDMGMPEGMAEGVEGGVPGGVPGGVIGGVVGGSGDGPVTDYDQPPRLLAKTQPVYPSEAFVKKIEGTVVLEILIDQAGRVARARVLQSIPALDQAAVQCVQQWRFSPAVKGGRPVPVIANAPVQFRIY